MKKIIALIIAASVLAITASAATPKYFYKPVKLPSYTITLPHYDFSYAVDAYLKEHPISIG